MTKSYSPLRYPGGKSKIYPRVKSLIEKNKLGNKVYVEPFSGGFGLGIRLLSERVIENAIINDYDKHIYHFWYSVLYLTEELIRLISDTPVTIDERMKQMEIYSTNSSDILSDGFATLFLNRVNFSGVILGGPLGGKNQSSIYKIDCRFNKPEIIKKIQQVASFRDNIELYNLDANELIKTELFERIESLFFNIDPPYVKKGWKLYKNYFNEQNHMDLKDTIISNLSTTYWIVTYDDCEFIREIYKNHLKVEYSIQHNAGNNIQGKEIVITNIQNDDFFW